jgi:Ca-activated chloride channel homolog
MAAHLRFLSPGPVGTPTILGLILLAASLGQPLPAEPAGAGPAGTRTGAASVGTPTGPPGPAPIVFVVDASGSMSEQFDGAPRMSAARVMLEEQLARLDPRTPVGLVGYGNRIPGCDSYRLYAPVARGNRTLINRVVQSMYPAGSTPIAATLRLIGQTVLAEHPRATIVLISDGAESCGGDPATEATLLARRGSDVRVHVIGLAVNRDTSVQLSGVAAAGRGRYFDVRNHTDFESAIRLSIGNNSAAPETETPPATPVQTPPPEQATTNHAPLEIVAATRVGEENGRIRVEVRYRFRGERPANLHVSLHAVDAPAPTGPGGRVIPTRGLFAVAGRTHYAAAGGEDVLVLEIPSELLRSRPIYVQGELWDINGVPASLYVSNPVPLNR